MTPGIGFALFIGMVIGVVIGFRAGRRYERPSLAEPFLIRDL